MSKENVFIVLSHKHSLRRGSQTEWEVSEKVEFVNKLKKVHLTMSSAIGDYLNRTMITGARYNMDDYSVFENYVRLKYQKQMDELDSHYKTQQKEIEMVDTNLFVDEFGNVRPATVFDKPENEVNMQ